MPSEAVASRPPLPTTSSSIEITASSKTATAARLKLSYEPPSSGSLLLRAFYQFAGIRTPGNLPLEDRVVLSAQKCAAWRALDYESDFPLAPDPFARLLAGSQYAVMVKRKEALKHKPRIPIRTRYFDNFITSCLKNFSNDNNNNTNTSNPAQIVLLGAGMDTRVYRLPTLGPQNTVFEVDVEAVLSVKQYLLGCVRPVPEARAGDLRRVVANLRNNGWVSRIMAAGFDCNVPTIWVLEGLLYYLEEYRVEALLSEIRDLSQAGSSLIFSAVTKISQARQGMFISAMADPIATVASAGFSKITVDVLGGANANFNRYPVPHPQPHAAKRRNGRRGPPNNGGRATIYVKAFVDATSPSSVARF